MPKNYKFRSDQVWFSSSIDFNSGSLKNIAPATESGDVVPFGQIQSMISSSSPETASWALNAISSSYSETSDYAIYAETASYVENAQTASYIDFNNIDNKPTLISGSEQIATEISGALGDVSTSLASRVSTNENNISTLTSATSSYVLNSQTSSMSVESSSYSSTASYVENAQTASFVEFNSIVNKPALLSSSAQIANDISGAFDFASASFSTRLTDDENNISSLINATSSYVLNSQTSSMSVESASYADTASIVLDSNIAYKNQANTFTEAQSIIVPNGGSSPIFLAQDTAMLYEIGIFAKADTIGRDMSFLATSSRGEAHLIGGYNDGLSQLTYLHNGTTAASCGAENWFTTSLPFTASSGLLVNSRGIVSNGDVIVNGDIIARNYIISSSVIHFTESFSSGSTRFGDSLDDTHQFTGSVNITGSLNATSVTSSLYGTASWAENAITSSNAMTASLAPLYLPIAGGPLSGTIHIDPNLITVFRSEFNDSGDIYASDMLMDGGSGAIEFRSLWNDSGSYMTLNQSSILIGDLSWPSFTGIIYAADYSANYTDRSLVDKGYISSITSSMSVATASYVEYTNVANKPTLISGSAQIASEISGAFTEASAGFENRITNNETAISNLQNDSASFSTRVSGNETAIYNLQTDSSSFSTRVSTNETNIGQLQTDSASFSIRVSDNEVSIYNLQTDSSSFSTRVSNNETAIYNLQTDSGSFSSRVTVLELGGKTIFSATASGDLTVIDSLSTSSFEACHWKYVVSSGSNKRAGAVMGVWDSAANVTDTDYSTPSLGNTDALSFYVDISESYSRLIASSSLGDWNIKVTRDTI